MFRISDARAALASLLGVLLIAVAALPSRAQSLNAGTLLGAPVVVVYPLAVTGATHPEAGDQISVLLAQRLAQLGGIVVKPATPGTDRSHYLSAALAQGADYYIAGYLTPVGGDVSMVTQVVATDAGLIVYSSTAIVRTYNDAVAQADPLRQAILGHSGRAYAQLDEPPSSAPPETPGPKGQGGFNLSHLFGGRRHAAPQAAQSSSPTPSSQAAAPQSSAAVRAVQVASTPPSALVTLVGGSASAQARGYAASTLLRALIAHGARTASLPVTPDEASAHAGDLCRANAGAQTLYLGSLTTASDAHGVQSADFALVALDCDGKVLAKGDARSPLARRGGLDATLDALVPRVLASLTASLRAVRPGAT
ncbi:MAG: hypothetical protein ACREM2_12250 [Vulcanimicrobiaceae bacterium]